jgi:hypothetical protein
VRRSGRHTWLVAVVRLADGAEVEVHPDRLEMERLSAGSGRMKCSVAIQGRIDAFRAGH